MIERMKSFEYHVGGQPVRVIVEGVPSPAGDTQVAKAAWFARHADRYRRGLLAAPRGHADMMAVLLTEPSAAHAHAGLVFLSTSGYPHLAMPGVIAAARAASEHGLVSARATDDHVERRLVFDTPAGTISARTRRDDVAPRDVVVGGVRAFVQAHGVSVPLPGRAVPVDVAFSGEFYALVDGEAAGVVLDSGHVADLRRLGRALCTALNRTTALVHPQDSAATGVAGVVFTGPARDEHAHLRTVLVSIDGAVDWSAGGSAAPAVMAVLDAMGLIGDGAPGFVHEGLSDTFGEGRVTARTTTDEREELVVEVRHELWATGEQIWLLDHDDPFVQGLPMPAREAVR